ncbi:Rv2578c family radical SAM protein [Zhihengliuella halotolerans]|uniref:DNA repair photolyase n=1 Tax=Zhihengliuella halotolerans TaxID=370736 RepID=A0A4Q8ADJ9_9MICC|nr:Rv2578c family radical SAM protein [Zhihengliuella halotolerans]RZU61841.1 DNA repair photolyase [Zhihengliuella halotolerans]
MRWEAQLIRPPVGQPDAGTGRVSPKTRADGADKSVAPQAGAPHPHSAEPLLDLPGLMRSVRTPEFDGIVFHEVVAKSALNKVPSGSEMPFSWTINPYRGCTHACIYCFARKTHTYLDFDYGQDFDSQVVVKRNVAEVLRAELGRPRWKREHVALGTNTDPYQRAEGRYGLMPEIIRALADSGTPFSILTKGTLLARDADLLAWAAARVPVGVGLSIAMTNDALSESIEPGTPSPTARFRLLERLAASGIECSVMAMPILPWLSDSEEALSALFSRVRGAGATSLTAGPLHLRPGAREWYMAWLARNHPHLVPRYQDLYRRGAVASKEYRLWLGQQVGELRRGHGFEPDPWALRRPEHATSDAHAPHPPSGVEPAQGSLF